jgi:hypothetical protein
MSVCERERVLRRDVVRERASESACPLRITNPDMITSPFSYESFACLVFRPSENVEEFKEAAINDV